MNATRMFTIGSSAAWLGTAASCGIDLPPPQPEYVEPAWVYNGEDAAIEVHGGAFYPRVEVDAAKASTAQIDRGFQVALVGPVDQGLYVDRTLPGVTLVDFTHLEAIVLGGLPPGTYDVVVTGPTGAQGTLSSGFVVTDTQVDRLVATVSSSSFEVHQVAWIDITVSDHDGNRLLEDLPIEISAERDGAALDVVWDSGDLELPSSAGATLSGGLGDDGAVRVGVVVDSPGLMEVVLGGGPGAPPMNETRLVLVWEPGSDLSLEIAPAATTVQAGSALPLSLTVRDQYGNEVSEPTDVLLIDACGSWNAQVEVVGPTSVDAVLTHATGTGSCKEESILALWGPAGETGPLTVVAAPATRFVVSAFGSEVVAGEVVTVLAESVDPWDNASDWSGDLGAVVLTDDLGTPVAATCDGDASVLLCDAVPTVAGPERTLEVGADGMSGVSGPFTVWPGEADGVSVAVTVSPVTAGEVTPFLVTVYDAWGNPLDPDDASGLVTLADPLADLRCDGGYPYALSWAVPCTLTRATASTSVSATLISGGATAATPPFPVVNGALAAVVVTPAAGSVVAGTLLEATMYAYDAWLNPYLVRFDPDLDVRDSAGAAIATNASIQPDGTATASLFPTLAGSTQIIVEQGGVELGRSGSVEVVPGDTRTLTLTPSEPWGWVGEETVVAVQAVDAWGNATDLEEPVTLTATGGVDGSVEDTLVAGVATPSLAWVGGGTFRIHAETAGGVDGDSATFLVGSRCADGPEVALSFGSRAEPVACRDPLTGTASVAITASGTAGSAAVARYALSIDGEAATVSSGGGLVATTDRFGPVPYTVLTQQVDTCATERSGFAWIGDDDGTATGPFVPVLSDETLTVGAGVSRVDLTELLDCAGDLAAGAPLFARTTRGAVGGAAPTGAGLTFDLDASGTGGFLVDARDVTAGGAVEVFVWGENGAASGQVAGEFVGDHLRPFVVRQTPSGDTVGEVSAVEVTFSEPILSPSRDTFTVSGPDVVEVVSAAIDADASTVTLTLDPAPTAEAGLWSVVVETDIRDLAGNRLDGTWTGTASTYNGAFGALPSALTPVDSCQPSTYVFRPDGDPGAGEEADEVVLDLRTASAPLAWLIDIRDASGERVRFAHVAALSSADTWSWDGRTTDEWVVENGTFTIEVDTDDGSGNRGGRCATVVTVDNRGG